MTTSPSRAEVEAALSTVERLAHYRANRNDWLFAAALTVGEEALKEVLDDMDKAGEEHDGD